MKEQQKNNLAYQAGAAFAVESPMVFIKHNIQNPLGYNPRTHLLKKGFFDGLGLVDDEEESSLVKPNLLAWKKEWMRRFKDSIEMCHKNADDIEYCQGETTKEYKNSFPELVPEIDAYWAEVKKNHAI